MASFFGVESLPWLPSLLADSRVLARAALQTRPRRGYQSATHHDMIHFVFELDRAAGEALWRHPQLANAAGQGSFKPRSYPCPGLCFLITA